VKKTTPHTIFIYSHGSFLRIVRGEHSTPSTTIKPRRYDSLKEALANERSKRILTALRLFPPDTLITRRLKSASQPINTTRLKTLTEAVKSKQFAYAQAGYDSEHREVAFIYHKNLERSTGLEMVRSGPVETVRKLLKKYKKPLLRELDYKDRRPKTVLNQEKVA
jgi:hypothetical protein